MQKPTKDGIKLIGVRTDAYDQLRSMGKMHDTFATVVKKDASFYGGAKKPNEK